MRLVLQRVTEGTVTVGDETVGSIGQGYVILLGIGRDDTEEAAERLADKLVKLRLFPDAQGKTNLTLKDVGGGVLVIPQFTLYADWRNTFMRYLQSVCEHRCAVWRPAGSVPICRCGSVMTDRSPYCLKFKGRLAL